MIYVQTYFIYGNNPYRDCGGYEIDKDYFIKIAKVSNFLLNQTGEEIHFWGNQKAINFVKNIGLKYHKYHLIPKEHDKNLNEFNKAFSLNKLLVPSLQTEDFYMIDLDFFMLDKKMLEIPKSKTLYVQHQEWHSLKYSKEWTFDVEDFLKNDLVYQNIYNNVKKLYINAEQIHMDIPMYNFGIVGGKASDLVPFYKFFYYFIVNGLKPECLSSCVIAIEQAWIPLVLKLLKFEIKEIYEINSLYKKNWKNFNQTSYELGLSHLNSFSKNTQDNFKEIDNFLFNYNL